MKRFCHVDESVLISIAENLQKCLNSTHCSPNGSTWLLHLFVIAFFVSYVSFNILQCIYIFCQLVNTVQHFQKLPSRSLMLSIFELSPDPVIFHQLYASLLPEVLSIPALNVYFISLSSQSIKSMIVSIDLCLLYTRFADHRQGEYILNFLKNSTPSHCYTLLCKLCTLDSNWPVDSYSVLEFLFDPFYFSLFLSRCFFLNLYSQCLAYVSSTPELSPSQLFVAVVNKFYHDAQKDSNLRKSIKFTNMIVKFLRNYASYYPSLQYPEESQIILKQLANENSTFLRNTLNNFNVISYVIFFRGERVFLPNPRTIYGGELMAQALMAASKTVSKDFRPNSLHCYFHDRCKLISNVFCKNGLDPVFLSFFRFADALICFFSANVLEPNDYYVTKLRDGRSFCHRLVEAFPINKSESDSITPYFRMDCSFKTPEKDAASFLSPMPNVPDNLPNVPRTRVLHYQSFDANSPIETVFCEPEYVLGFKSNVGGQLHSWIRLKEPPSASLHSYRDAFLAYLSDAFLLWVALTEPHHVLYLVTLNQSIWFHNPEVEIKPDEWILIGTRANYVGSSAIADYQFWNSV
ncbi:uncharacterized protein DC041_0004168 [Schistosoma bovis]|uniref:Acyl-CoA thioesterase 2 C-terminal domain-containing protein n=1 Tax=Schistosoma bovis TaxID=6184 RepID=A0A430QR12_SCHBO|nr:uncharacterized protein DC041_0004168 [Schistosoma bovis]